MELLTHLLLILYTKVKLILQTIYNMDILVLRVNWSYRYERIKRRNWSNRLQGSTGATREIGRRGIFGRRGVKEYLEQKEEVV